MRLVVCLPACSTTYNMLCLCCHVSVLSLQDNAVAVKTLPVTPVKAVKTHLYACTWLQGNAVAVKTLNKQHFTEATQDALRREALAMFARPHPCIAHVYGERYGMWAHSTRAVQVS